MRKKQADLLRNFTFTLVTNRMLTISETVGDFCYVEFFLDRRHSRWYLIVIFLNVRATVSGVSRQFRLIDAES